LLGKQAQAVAIAPEKLDHVTLCARKWQRRGRRRAVAQALLLIEAIERPNAIIKLPSLSATPSLQKTMVEDDLTIWDGFRLQVHRGSVVEGPLRVARQNEWPRANKEFKAQ
jgi:hypothetical protein